MNADYAIIFIMNKSHVVFYQIRKLFKTNMSNTIIQKSDLIYFLCIRQWTT